MIAAVLLISSLLIGFVQAGGEEDKPVTNLKLGNQTIERVSIAYILVGWVFGRMVTAYNNHLAFSVVLELKKSSFYFRHYNFGHIQYMHRISTRICKIGKLFLEPYSHFNID